MLTTAPALLGLALLLLPPPPRRTAVAAATGSLPLALDLVAAALVAGQPIAGALEVSACAAPAAQADGLSNVAGLLRLGADPPEAWRSIADDPQLVDLARVAGRSALSGARLADAFGRQAARVRRSAIAADEARAHRASVLMALPLAVCFLPAFVCLGIVPTLVGLAGPALRTSG